MGPFVDPDLLADLAGESVDRPAGPPRPRRHRRAAGGTRRAATRSCTHSPARPSAARPDALPAGCGCTTRGHGRWRPGSATDPDTAATIAHHAHLAAPLGSAAGGAAARWLARAASLAASRHAHAEALALWELALADAEAATEAAYDAFCGKAAALLRLARTRRGT